MNGEAVLTVPRFTGQADTSSTGEEVSDIEQTHLTERGHAGVSDQGPSPQKYYNYFGHFQDNALSQWKKCCNSVNAFSHSGINYIITFIILFESDIIAFMLKKHNYAFFFS